MKKRRRCKPEFRAGGVPHHQTGALKWSIPIERKVEKGVAEEVYNRGDIPRELSIASMEASDVALSMSKLYIAALETLEQEYKKKPAKNAGRDKESFKEFIAVQCAHTYYFSTGKIPTKTRNGDFSKLFKIVHKDIFNFDLSDDFYLLSKAVDSINVETNKNDSERIDTKK